MESTHLARVTKADSSAFAEHFRGVTKECITSFLNLSGETILVAPVDLSLARERNNKNCYRNICSFVRKGPSFQVSAFFQVMGEKIKSLFKSSKSWIWISTSGLGVPWLHLRIAPKPKYYQYEPFKKVPMKLSVDSM